MRRVLLMLGLLTSVSWVHAQTATTGDRLKNLQADPSALQTAIAVGKKASFFCTNCHGEGGISQRGDVPNLASQHPAYLLEQIRKFGSGERKDPFMQGLIKVLSNEERVQIALYYASVAVKPSTADAVLLPRGKELFVHLCVRCHGQNAHGNELFPRIAGQKQMYLQSSITRYRDTTGVRNNQLMAIATGGLKNDDIKALSHYLTQLP